MIDEAKQLRADLESYGMVKLSDEVNVTDSTGLALPATEKNPDIEGTLAREIVKRTSTTVYRKTEGEKGIKDGDIIEASVDVPENGVYIISVCVSACGAGNLAKESPFFECRLLNNQSVIQLFNRPTFNINISKIWDDGNITTVVNFLQAGVLNAEFTSHTGGILDSNYNSGFGIQIAKI